MGGATNRSHTVFTARYRSRAKTLPSGLKAQTEPTQSHPAQAAQTEPAQSHPAQAAQTEPAQSHPANHPAQNELTRAEDAGYNAGEKEPRV